MEEAMVVFLQLVFGFGFGIACAVIASKRGRNPLAWFFIGMFTNCIGLILVLVLENPLEKEQRLHRLHQENRRLREIVRGDRITADRRFQETIERLKVHDEVLGVDTSRLSTEAPVPALDKKGDVQKKMETWRGQPWYFAEGDVRVGPVAFDELKNAFNEGRVKPETLVWTPDFGDWKALRKVDGLEGLLSE